MLAFINFDLLFQLEVLAVPQQRWRKPRVLWVMPWAARVRLQTWVKADALCYDRCPAELSSLSLTVDARGARRMFEAVCSVRKRM